MINERYLTPEHVELMQRQRALIVSAIGQGINTVAGLLKVTHMTKGALRKRIEKLQNDGLIEFVGSGKYRIPTLSAIPDWPETALVWAGYPLNCISVAKRRSI